MESQKGPILGRFVLIIGPSGVGKSVIIKRLRARHPDLHIPHSATTRKRRANEGDDLYLFVEDAEFDDMLKDGKFLEWALVHDGARYGTMAEDILPAIKAGKTVVREVDVQGFESIMEHPVLQEAVEDGHVVSIFIMPESMEQLIEHIRKRSPITDDELKRRMKSAEREFQYTDQCDAVILNREGKVDETVKEVERILGL